MARIADSERIARLLGGEGGSLSRREIIEKLGLSDERYEMVAAEMVADERATKNRGRAGGLRLTDGEEFPDEDESLESEVGLERQLYPAFAKYLVAASGEESKSVVLETHRTRLGKWETPDLAEVLITPFPMVGQWELRIVAYELKCRGRCQVDAVLQAAAYNQFAHESWLVIPKVDESDWAENFGPRVVQQARHFGIGLGSFDRDEPALTKHIAPRPQVPLLQRQQEWLEFAVDRPGEERKKVEIARHVRWARRKANLARDLIESASRGR
jgi:hypothetical protein